MDSNIPEKLFEQFHNCVNLFDRSRSLLMPTALMKDIGRGQGHVMGILLEQDGLTPKELSNTLNIRAASLGELVDKLENNGYITRQAHESDRRTFRVFLTDKGREIAIELTDIRKNALGSLFQGLSEEEQQTLEKLLDKLIASLHQPDRKLED
ncbi:MarR family winged helix-turn-helix transcriptional regulator [Anaerocolumna chitinilytica]|uniref:MarR family transcriptional regulator n=1 Tax=Anaerocolumna chitinilytica TaxID=1727145 RepID=A0A7I8DNW4_9FIRM|nr:MarR family transcriptional regulator [Anaerocolumna chitinilytica]BCJ98765.1 MarR family transcriptional regulator [Anaerocolumna chitinilytica]